MKLSAILEPLIAAGVPGDVILATVKAFEEQQGSAVEKGREKARARWHRWNEKRLQTFGDVSNTLVRVEDSSSKKEDKKEEKKEGRSQATRLPADWTIPHDWLMEAVTAGMSTAQAAASASRMHNWSLSDTKAKKLDWHATWRNWFQRDLPKPNSTASPPAPRNAGERAFLKLQAENGHEPTDTAPRRLEAGDGRRQIEGYGDAGAFAGTQGAFGRN